MKKTIFLAGTALLAVAGLLFLVGCRNSVTPPVNETGILQVMIGDDVIGRAILPDVELDSFDQFRLDFTPVSVGPAMRAFHIADWDGTSAIELDVGTWDLRVTAFLYTVPGLAGMTPEQALAAAVAVGYYSPVVVTPREPVAITVDLEPIIYGYGTFSWEIEFEPNAGVVTAVMDITGTAQAIDNINILVRDEDYEELAAGLYTVLITMTNNAHPEPETVRIPQYLRIYQNLPSHLEMTFTYLHFPQTLLNHMLNLWTGSYWDFTRRGIAPRHFVAVGIEGVNDGNFAAVHAQMNAITLASGTPPVLPINLDTFGHLVDAALMAIAVADRLVDPADFNTRSAVANALITFAENTPAASISYDHDNIGLPHYGIPDFPHVRLIVIIGAYEVEWDIPRIVGYPGDDRVSITAPPPLVTAPYPSGRHRVGDLLTANISLLRGEGAPRYRWYRSAAIYPVIPPADTSAFTVGGVRIASATAATYELHDDDVNRHVAVEVRRSGYFGYVISTNMIGPVVHLPVEANITVQFEGFNGIDLILTDNSIRLYYYDVDPTVTLNVAPATGNMTNVRWYIGWHALPAPAQPPAPIATGTTLVINDAIHGRRIGEHHITVRATINGAQYSRVIIFEVYL